MIFRIAHITLSMGTGGIENLIINLVGTLDSRKFDNTIICLDEGGGRLDQFHRTRGRSFVTGRRPGFDWRLILKLSRLFSEERFHIIHTHNQAAHFYAGIAASISRIPVLVTTEHSRHNTDKFLRRRVEKRFLAMLSDRWITVSKELAELSMSVDGIPSKKICVINNGIDTEKFNSNNLVAQEDSFKLKNELNLSEKTKFIIMVARFNPIKRHRLFLQAFAEIAGKYGDIHVLFVGDGACRDELLQLTKTLNVDEKVHFLGVRHDIPELLRASTLFLLCSESEGLPLSLLEACAAGTQVLITASSNRAGFIKSGINGLEVAGSVAALAEGLDFIFTSQEENTVWLENSRRLVEQKYSLTAMCDQYEQLYMDLLKGKGFDLA